MANTRTSTVFYRTTGTLLNAFERQSTITGCKKRNCRKPYDVVKNKAQVRHSSSPSSALLSRSNQRRFSTNSDMILEDEAKDRIAVEKDEPFKLLLAMPARAGWRAAAPMPEDIDKARGTVLTVGGRKRKPLRLAHEKVLDAQTALQLRRDRERMRVNANLEYSAEEKRRDGLAAPVLYGPDQSLAHFYFRLYPQYSVMRRILKEAVSLVGTRFKPKRVLDFGIGCGSASAAALLVFSDSIEWVHGVDPSETMQEGAKLFLDSLLEQQESKRLPRVTFATHVSADASSNFDLALFAYTACEFAHNEATLAAAGSLWEKLSPGGLFVMIEPGTPDGFSSIRTVRNMLLDCAKGECEIIAPCTHSGMCPIKPQLRKKYIHKRTEYDVADIDRQVEREESTDIYDLYSGTNKGYCSFTHSMPDDDGKGEKFSYLVAQKAPTTLDADSKSSRLSSVNFPALIQKSRQNALMNEKHDHSPNQKHFLEATELERQYLESTSNVLGLELIQGDQNRRSNYGRIVVAPLKRKGHIYIDSCVAPGKIVRQKISKSMSQTTPGLFAAARKARWGGLWPNVPLLHDKSK